MEEEKAQPKKIKYELQLDSFLEKMTNPEYRKSKEKVTEDFKIVLKAGIDLLSASSNVNYNEEMLEEICKAIDISDVYESRPNVREYVVRKHVKEIVHSYISSVDNKVGLKVKDETFGLSLERLGFKLGLSRKTDSADRSLDSNILISVGGMLGLGLGLICAGLYAFTKYLDYSLQKEKMNGHKEDESK